MWFNRFTVFQVHEYHFHTYIWTRIVQSRFLFYSQLKIHSFYDKFNFMLQQLLANQNQNKKFWVLLLQSYFFPLL